MIFSLTSAALLALAGLFWLEPRLVYLPTPLAGASYATTPADVGIPFERLELTTPDGSELVSWLLVHEDASNRPYNRPHNRPYVLYFHGNGSNLSGYVALCAALYQLGANVLMLEYRGYGESSGSPSEQGLYQDAKTAYDALRARGVNPNQIVLYGFSLGTGVATYLASQVEVAGVMLEAPFTSLPAAARAAYGPLTPTFLMRNRFNSLARIDTINAPLMVMHASSDRIIPIAQGKQLFEAASDPKTFITLTGDHNTLVNDLPNETLTQAWRDFFASIAP
jgi:fermentation-respiration switch protein FrsA (DUF1100 family)